MDNKYAPKRVERDETYRPLNMELREQVRECSRTGENLYKEINRRIYHALACEALMNEEDLPDKKEIERWADVIVGIYVELIKDADLVLAPREVWNGLVSLYQQAKQPEYETDKKDDEDKADED